MKDPTVVHYKGTPAISKNNHIPTQMPKHLLTTTLPLQAYMY